MSSIIPKISLTALDSLDATTVQTLGEALSHSGFLRLVDHGVDLSLYPRAYEIGRHVFAMSSDEKASFVDAASMGLRGYLSVGSHLLDLPSYNRVRAGQAQALLEKPRAIAGSSAELWHVGHHPEMQHWPARFPEFQKVMSDLFTQLERCSEVILKSCGVYLANDMDLIEEKTRAGLTTLRLMKYPAPPLTTDKKINLGDPHEDVSLMTFFSEGQSGGLEIQTPDEKWHPVVQEDQEIIIGVGDMLASLTNGIFRSGTHRVQYESNHKESRMTMPFFVAPRADVSLYPLPVCVEISGRKAQFPEMSAIQLLIESLKIGEHVRIQQEATETLTTPSPA